MRPHLLHSLEPFLWRGNLNAPPCAEAVCDEAASGLRNRIGGVSLIGLCTHQYVVDPKWSISKEIDRHHSKRLEAARVASLRPLPAASLSASA